MLLFAAVTVIGAGYFAVDRLVRSKRPAAGLQTSASTGEPGGPAQGAIHDKSIAVLPFVDMSEKKDQEYFADGMAEEILDRLAKVPELKIIGRTSSFQFKGKNEDLRAIGNALAAAYVLEGSVRKVGDRVRVTAQLIDTQRGTHLWSNTYDRDFGDVLNLEEQIAGGIARALQVTIDSYAARPARRLRNVEAYNLLLRGRLAIDRGDADALRESEEDFKQAVALDPELVEAEEGLADALVAQVANGYLPVHIGWENARVAAERTLRLDPNSAPAHALLGARFAFYAFDFPAADAELAKALALSPRNSSALAARARVALMRGRFDEARRLLNAAIAVDPLSPYYLQLLGVIHYLDGQLPEAEAALRKSIEVSPKYAASQFVLGQILLARGDRKAALSEMEKEMPDGGRDAGLAIVYHALAKHAESDAALAQLTRRQATDWPYGIAQAHAFRGERDAAFLWLERAYSQRDPDLQFVRSDPLLKNVAGDPRYKALLRKMNLIE